MDVSDFRKAHLDLLARSNNCSEGHAWIWRQFGQCLEKAEQTFGFICGIVLVFMWTAAHVTIYKLKRQHAHEGRLNSIRFFLAVHWSAEILGCIGAGLAQQLTTQIILCLSAVFVNSVCSLHYLFVPLVGRRKKMTKHRVFRTRNLSARLMKCLFPLVAMFSIITVTSMTASSAISKREMLVMSLSKPVISLLWIVGYTFGSLAGILYCSTKTVEACDSYMTTESDKLIDVAYSSSIVAHLLYVISVWTQSQSLRFFTHSLPWTLPRVISAGLDFGILIQRIIQKGRTKGRKLSKESLAGLLSSDMECADVSSSDSEEVIWMPLKTLELPTHPVTASRIQILSDSDAVYDKVDYLCDSGQFSMSETSGAYFEQELVSAETEAVGDEDDVDAEGLTSEADQINAMSKEITSNGEQSDKSQTNSDTEETTTSDEDGKKVLERQISNLSTVSGEEKIAVWIQSSSTNGEQIQTNNTE